ncbi:unnamed protein product [Discosporangium mesarthrocarpum]
MVSKVEGEEEEDEGYQKHNEAGDPVEPFNLRTERDLGYFDANGNFVWRTQDEEPDAWLAEMDEGAMEEAIGVASRRWQHVFVLMYSCTGALRAVVENVTGEKPDPLSVMSTGELREALLEMLQPGETAIKALKRLGKKTKTTGRRLGDGRQSRTAEKVPSGGTSTGKKSKLQPRSAVMEGKGDGVGGGGAASWGSNEEGGEGEHSIEEEEEMAFARVTDLADALLQAGQHDIYQQSKEELLDQAEVTRQEAMARGTASYFSSGQDSPNLAGQAVGAEGGAAGAHMTGLRGAAGTPRGDNLFFEYRGIDGNIHGPFGLDQIRLWMQAGYFDKDKAVMMRQVRGLGTNEDGNEITPPSNVGTGGRNKGGEISKGTASSSADLIADLDDDDDGDDRVSGIEGGGGKEEEKKEADIGLDKMAGGGEWVRSDQINWLVF